MAPLFVLQSTYQSSAASALGIREKKRINKTLIAMPLQQFIIGP
jgi:hypothetical protein